MSKFTAYEKDLLDYFNKSNIDYREDEFGPLSDREKVEMARSFKLGDDEYVGEVVGRGGPTIAEYVDPDRVNVVASEHNVPGVSEASYNRAGQYVPSYGDGASLVQTIKGLSSDSYVQGNETPDDSVVLYGKEGLSGDTSAHEFMHRRDVKEGGRASANHEAHLNVYAELGYRARNDEEFDDSVRKLLFFMEPNIQTWKQADELMPKYRDRMLNMIEARKAMFEREETAALDKRDARFDAIKQFRGGNDK